MFIRLFAFISPTPFQCSRLVLRRSGTLQFSGSRGVNEPRKKPEIPLVLTAAEPADAVRIAEIHMAAFGSNAMLIAQFPTPAVRDALKKSIELKALADINDPKIIVLVVQDCSLENQGGSTEVNRNGQSLQGPVKKTIAFAKWIHPVALDEHYIEPPWVWPAGTDFEVLESWTRRAEEAQSRAVGDAPCYHLTFMGTDPQYEGRGAATMMTKWGLEQSKKNHVPAYLESTLETAQFYRKLGFVDGERFSLEYKTAYSEIPEVYEEISFVSVVK